MPITMIPSVKSIYETSLGLGIPVTATARAHANADVDTFTVADGSVLVTLIYGVITVAPGGAVNISAGNNPTIATGTTVAWWTAADVNGADIGDIIGVDLPAGTPTTCITQRVQSAVKFVALAGTIFVRGTAVQGTSQWTLYYIPITAGASVVTV